MSGLRKSHFINSLISEYQRQNIPYDVKEIKNLSVGQLRKRVKKLKGDRYTFPDKHSRI